ncbi:unnamed protein product [Mycena citricolor]|uniref:DUF7330 domain-containing protein n=1 Tax=Mycena citricolor TaxID=2018698 RepID=A0AAD2JVM8_9AGAR|nr:unnamed protein product [Mycena citricolor]
MSDSKGAIRLPVYTDEAVPERPHHTSKWIKLGKVCLISLVAWMFFSSAATSVFSGVSNLLSGEYHYPIPSDITTSDCVSSWDVTTPHPSRPWGYHYTASAEPFSFGVPEEALLLLSKGSLQGGSLHISVGDDEDVQVQVTVLYSNEEARDLARVCMIERADGEKGVGIFTPTQSVFPPRQSNRLRFEVELVLPQSAYIKLLSTDVSNFKQNVDALKDVVDFGKIMLRGSNGEIRTEAVAADTDVSFTTSNGKISSEHMTAPVIDLHSSNGAVSGRFSASQSFGVVTSNGRVDLSLTLNATGSEEPKVSIKTSNSALNAELTLLSQSGSGGVFPIRTETSNGRLDTKVVEAPIDSVITLDARTSNSAGSIELPATYEGLFSISTSNAKTSMHRVSGNDEDPKCAVASDCEPRKRHVQTKMQNKGHVAGTVFWEQGNEDRGKATLRTSNGPADIYL